MSRFAHECLLDQLCILEMLTSTLKRKKSTLFSLPVYRCALLGSSIGPPHALGWVSNEPQYPLVQWEGSAGPKSSGFFRGFLAEIQH